MKPFLFLNSLILWVSASLAFAAPSDPIVIGLNADMSGSTKLAGTAIERGAKIAISEINQQGGVLGRPLELMITDHRGNPARGKDNVLDLSAVPELVAILGGLHTPVVLAELELIHQEKVPYLVPWAAGTTIIDNGYSPNYVFRVSVRDEFASEYLLDQAIKQGFRSPCLLLENTGWGRSNQNGFQKAAQKFGVTLPDTQWFNWGAKSFRNILAEFSKKRCDVIMLVSNAREAVFLVQDMANLLEKQRVPIISHWGITGADFPKLIEGYSDKIELTFLQTYSFFSPTRSEVAERIIEKYYQQFDTSKELAAIVSPVGTAHAYDLIHLLARALKRANSSDRDAVRAALEKLDRYEGLVRVYEKPFTETRHDALDRTDFRLARYGENGEIIPLETVD
ncbi:ABC transporter substrate-binding protein [Sneathiella limimaris]|uniref:ABC transporter substrate-binding protein n=1 Tax=Sneathiella limimaris TaxID=1964213 RepID=UPI00146E72B1|nr:ABC transporter substrate-binding protein [Sneathiella limimaris]